MRHSFNGLLIERLDARQLLAADFPSINPEGTLSFVGNNQNNTVEVSSLSPTRNVVTVDGRQYFFGGRVKRIFISGQGGNDVIRNNTFIPSTLSGEAGNDSLYGGYGNDTLRGGSGNDRIEGRSGNDRLDGGSGRDGMFGGSGMDVFEALDGEPDFLDGGPDEDAMNLDLSDTFINI